MKVPPKQIADTIILWYTPIDERHRQTGRCRHILGSVVAPGAAGVEIGERPHGAGFFLFSCGPAWSPITDTWHASIEEAKRQVEFEYEGVTETWVEVPK